MDPRINAGPTPSRRRVFVLVDKGESQGVFTSWDAAEAYAEANRFTLDHLLEFETNPDHPDHLHLMAGLWEGTWKFIGEWTRGLPPWKSPPEKVRLDHYHLRKSAFHLLRQKEFVWSEGLTARVNPMAPEQALSVDAKAKNWSPTLEWKPKLTPLKPVGKPPPEDPIDQDREGPRDKGPLLPEEPPIDLPSTAHSEPEEPGQSLHRPLLSEPEPPIEETPGTPAPAPSTPRIKPTLINWEATDTARSGGDRRPGEGHPSTPPKKPKPGLSSKNPLRLKAVKQAPRPIPEFKPAQTHDPAAVGELSPVQPALGSSQGSAPTTEKGSVGRRSRKPRRIWPLRLILPLAALFLCWAAGIYWVLRPEPTAQEIVAKVTSLNAATVLIIEPGQVFFQLHVDPIQQQRWIRSLGLDPIPVNESIPIPYHLTLDTWEKPDGFIRPPYAAVEVREWWNLRLRVVKYGYVHRWEDGSYLLMDLESDMLIGWARAHRLPELLN